MRADYLYEKGFVLLEQQSSKKGALLMADQDFVLGGKRSEAHSYRKVQVEVVFQ